MIRIDKSPLYNEPCTSSHLVAARFHYVYNIFEIQDSEGYWFLLKGSEKYPDWSEYLWNLFKGALNVVIYNFEEIPLSSLSTHHRNQFDRLINEDEFVDIIEVWDA